MVLFDEFYNYKEHIGNIWDFQIKWYMKSLSRNLKIMAEIASSVSSILEETQTVVDDFAIWRTIKCQRSYTSGRRNALKDGLTIREEAWYRAGKLIPGRVNNINHIFTVRLSLMAAAPKTNNSVKLKDGLTIREEAWYRR